MRFLILFASMTSIIAFASGTIVHIRYNYKFSCSYKVSKLIMLHTILIVMHIQEPQTYLIKTYPTHFATTLYLEFMIPCRVPNLPALQNQTARECMTNIAMTMSSFYAPRMAQPTFHLSQAPVYMKKILKVDLICM